MNFLFTCGGTAGHINPALAVAGVLRDRMPDCGILFVGANGKMETDLVPRAGYDIVTVEVTNIHRSLKPSEIAYNFRSLHNARQATKDARKIIEDFQPDIAIGTGGYVSGPILRCALKMHIPVLVHESNAFPGKTVKELAREGATVLLYSEDARRFLPAGSKAVVTGNPLRPEFLHMDAAAKRQARRELSLDDRPLVLSFGGSLGARHINEAMVGVLQKSHALGKLQHIHGVGKAGYADTCAALQAAGVPLDGDGISVREYIDDMPRCMAAADLVICRCGDDAQ